MRVLVLSLFLLFSSEIGASLPTVIKCTENVCISITKHSSERFRDYYFYEDSAGVRSTIVRFESGAIISLTLNEVEPRLCLLNRTQVMSQTVNTIVGRGCLARKDRTKALAIKYVVVSKKQNSKQFMLRTDPVIWLSGFDAEGEFMPAASPILPLGGFD